MIKQWWFLINRPASLVFIAWSAVFVTWDHDILYVGLFLMIVLGRAWWLMMRDELRKNP